MKFLTKRILINVALFTFFATFLFGFNAFSQQKGIDNSIQTIERHSADNTPTSISFSLSAHWQKNQAQEVFKKYLGINGTDNVMAFSNSTTTKLMVTTDRYNQYYKGIKIEFAGYTLTSKDNLIHFMTGNYYNANPTTSTLPAIAESEAFGKAKAFVGAEKYMWEDPTEETRIKGIYHKPDTSFLPKGELVWIEDFISKKNNKELHLAWSFDIYAQKPLSRQKIYIDAITGQVLLSNSLIKHTAATGHSKYSGVIPFITSHVGANYILYDSTRGNGVHTLNMHNGSSYGASTEFTSATNSWPTAAADTQALDAHWGGEIVYDYWSSQQGRLSWDNLNGILLQYVHYNTNFDNAFWDGTEMTYGDGSGCGGGGFTPLTSLDVTAHEIGHGVCQATCNLVYAGESGGIDEGLSDCWGATIENWGNPHEVDAVSKKPWWMGEEIGCGVPLRRLDSPKLFGLPDTYLGINWYTVGGCTPSGGNDQCGVHTNMGVLTKWYYLVTIGAIGINDIGNSYNVNGIGWTEAANILYQTELALSSTTTYPQARTVSINTATTLYGACSPEVQSVTNAWYAVGVGTAFTPCTPQIGFTTTVLNISEKAPTITCPASKVINIGLKPAGPAITGGNPIITVIAAGGTAIAGTNYALGTTVLTFLAGDTTTHFATITIFDNGAVNDNKTLKLAFTLAAAGSTASISPTNDTMTINIYNDDSIPNIGGIEYHTLNSGSAVTSNLTSAFYASRRRNHSQFLLNASEMTAAGVRPGVPISQIGFNVTTKNSTTPFTGYTISMGNTAATDLSTAFATPVTQVYTGNPSSNLGLDTLDFNTSTFTWDGTSNVAVEVCFGMNATAVATNDQMDGIQQGAQIVCDYNGTSTGAGTGCTITYNGTNTSTARPVMRFKQLVPPTPVETAMGSTRIWDVHAGQEVYFYNPTDTNIIAGLKNISNDLGCVTATVTQQGIGFTPAVFATVNRSLKEFSITPTINPAITTYDATIYFKNTELNGVLPTALYLLKTDAPTDATVTTANSVELTPTLITGTNYVGFKGTFTGFSRFFLVDGPLCNAPTIPTSAIMPPANCTGTIALYSVNTVPGATSYTWTVTGTGWSGASTTDSINLTTGTGTATVSVVAVNACAASTAYTFTVTPLPLPTLPVVTTPGVSPCPGAGTYTALSTGATSYNWAVAGTGWSGASGTGTLMATIGTGVGQIIVNGTNACGNGPSDTINVTPSSVPVIPVISLSGTLPCFGATTATYNSTSAGATSFSWTVLGTGWSGTSITGSIIVTLGTGTGTIICSGVNACGNSIADTALLTASPLPTTPTLLLTSAIPCLTSTSAQYVANSMGALSYSWLVLGTGWSGTSTTDTLNLTVGSGTGTIICTGINTCGGGTSDTVYITPTSGVGAASAILSTSGICEGSTATFITSSIVGATSYVWVVTGTGWSGSSTTNIITLTVGTSPATISVYGTGACGSGSSYTLFSVIPAMLPTANFTEAAHLEGIGVNDLVTYAGSAPASGTFSWNFGGGGVAVPGIGIGPHLVSWATTGLKTITLSVTDSGCSSVIFSDTVLVVTTTELNDIIANKSAVNIVPNPNNGVFDIVFETAISNAISVRLTDVQGKIVFQEKFDNAPNKTLAIDVKQLANAVYTATIITEESVINKKVVICK